MRYGRYAHFKDNKTKSQKLKITKLRFTQMAREGVYIEGLDGLVPHMCHALSFMTAKCAHCRRVFRGMFPTTLFSTINYDWFTNTLWTSGPLWFGLGDAVFCAWNVKPVHFPCGLWLVFKIRLIRGILWSIFELYPVFFFYSFIS